MNDYSFLEELLNYRFQDKGLLLEALTHKSYSHEHKLERNYERLEFLGDAVLQLIVTEYLVAKYKEYDEGMLSKYRGYFVSEQFLSELSKIINLGDFVRLGKGEEQSGGKFKSSLLCDIFESLIAAIYIDGGYNHARSVVINLASDKIDETIDENRFIDGKTELQKLTQKRFEQLPEYKVISEDGPEHDKTFLVEVYIGGKPVAKGKGKSKKKAEQDAAKKALYYLQK
jgi:ribonuclease-3